MKFARTLAAILFCLALGYCLAVVAKTVKGQDLVITEVVYPPIDQAVIDGRLAITKMVQPARCDCGCESEAVCDCAECPNKLTSVLKPYGVVYGAQAHPGSGSTPDASKAIPTTSERGLSGRAGALKIAPARSIYDSHGAPIVPAPVPDEIAGDMLAINGPLKKLTARTSPRAAATLTLAPVQTPTKPAPAPPPQQAQPQGYWARSSDGSTCRMVWVPAQRATVQQPVRQYQRRGILRRW